VRNKNSLANYMLKKLNVKRSNDSAVKEASINNYIEYEPVPKIKRSQKNKIHANSPDKKIAIKESKTNSFSTKNSILIKMDENKVREMAYDLSQQPKSYDDFVWLLAEQELKLKNAFNSPINPLTDNFPEMISIDPKKIIDIPNADETKALAELIAKQGPSVEKLHWFLAERVYIVNNAKKDN
jgi:hypothetical protein